MSSLIFSVSPSATSITEGGAITFTVNLSSPYNAIERVNYDITFSSADQSDFTGMQSYSGTLSFEPNQTTKSISFTTLDDQLKEISEQFRFSLINVEEWTSISDTAGSATITILDNDTPATTYIGRDFGSYTGTSKSDNLVVTSNFNSINTGKGDDVISLDTFNSNIDGGEGNDEITTLDPISHSTINGGDGDDSINLNISHSKVSGGNGIDSINLDASHTTVSGGDGNDLIIAEGNFLYLSGDVGDDIVRPKEVGFATIDGGSGTDTIDFSQYENLGLGIKVNLNLKLIPIDIIGVSTITNFENVIGTNLADTITGNSSSNLLNGGGGHDTILSGSGGDLILAGDGEDQIDGQAGTDTLTGGGGNDLFVFSSSKDLNKALTKADTITDFTRGEDKIQLNFDSNTKVKGTQTFNFIGSQLFSKKAGELRYTPTITDKDGTKYVFLQGDTNGDGNSDFAIKLLGVTSLVQSDFG